MAVAHYRGGGSVTTTDSAVAASLTITLTDAGVNTFQRITDLSIYAIGTVTAYTLEVFKNDGSTSITKIGGQVGGAATGPLGPAPYSFTTPINCAVNDNAKITLTATGATTVGVSANYIFGTK